MAHELYTLEDGKASIGYVGETPWHGLGQKIEEGADLLTWQKQAGLDWTIQKASVYFGRDNDLQSYPTLVPDRVALYRSDNGLPLSIMSDRYQIVQPSEILEFYRNLIEAGDFQMDTAGSIFNGRKIWALARIGKDVTIKGDKLEGFLLLSTSCDGSLATTAQFTSVRVVCNNTLTMAVDRGSNRYAVKVPHHREFNAEEVKVELGLANNVWDQHVNEMERMIERQIRRREAVNVLIRAFGDPTVCIDDQPNLRAMASVIELWEGKGIGSNMDSAKGTAWGLLNAVTQFADHNRTTRTRDNRLDSAWFGKWEGIKRKVVSEILNLFQ